jgi:hypothetical protein
MVYRPGRIDVEATTVTPMPIAEQVPQSLAGMLKLLAVIEISFGTEVSSSLSENLRERVLRQLPDTMSDAFRVPPGDKDILFEPDTATENDGPLALTNPT